MTLWPVDSRFARLTSSEPSSGRSKPAVWGLPVSKEACTASMDSPALSMIAAPSSPFTVAATMPESLTAVSNLSGTRAPALGDRGPVTTMRPAAPRSRAASALKRRPE